jgi:hypothetical protein
MSASEGERETPGWASCFPAATLVAWAFLRIGTWFGRDYTHDDFYFAYLSWLRAVKARPGVDVDVFLYTPLVELFSPFFRLWPESFLPLDLGRAFILGVALTLLGLVYALSRRLGTSVAWALCVVSFTAWQGDFLLRISDVRTDPIATCLLLATFLFLLRAEGSRPLLAGTFFGMAVFFNIKLAVAVPAVGLAVVLTSMKVPIRALLRFAAGAVIGTLLWNGFRALSDGWGPIVAGLNALLSAPLAGSGSGPTTSTAAGYFQRAILNAPISALLVAVGALGTIAVPLWQSPRQDLLAGAGGRRLVYGCSALVFLAVFVRVNPFLFPYNFVVLMPVLSAFIPGLPAFLPRGFSPVARAALLALATVMPASEGLAALSATAGLTNMMQRRVVKWIWNATDPSERVFDWQGMHWGRRGTYHWWMFSGWLPAYEAGKAYSVGDELKASQVTLVIDNYRLGWFHRADREFFATHYARLDYCLFAPGREFTKEELEAGGVLDVFVPGFYRLDPPDAVSRLLVDGHPAARLMRLEDGVHPVTLVRGETPTTAKIVFTTRRREQAGLPCTAPTTLSYGF